MKKTIEQCPKTLEKYKEFLITSYKEQYGKENYPSFGDNMLSEMIVASPMMMVYFFDAFNIIGTIAWDKYDSEFICVLNGDELETIPEVFTERKQAESTLIKYMFTELEKTL
jgi:hypothetical protein